MTAPTPAPQIKQSGPWLTHASTTGLLTLATHLRDFRRMYDASKGSLLVVVADDAVSLK